MKKAAKNLGYFVFLIATVLLILEFSFRLQLFDFYEAEFQWLNTEEQLEKKAKTVMVVGDSFSAQPNNYVDQLRKMHPDIRFINIAVPGTGLKQQKIIFKKRIKTYHPDEIIFQFYTGNDFLDVNPPVNWKEVSFLRNLYWTTSNHFLFLHYLNFKTSGLNSNSVKQKSTLAKSTGFSPESYSSREKILFTAQPDHILNAALLQKEALKSYEVWHKRFASLLRKRIDDSVTVNLLIIPHAAQCSEQYVEQMKKVGAKLDDRILSPNPAVVQKMAADFKKVNVISPLPAFQEKEEEGTSLYYDNDPHLNDSGQTFLARYLSSRLFQ